MQMDKMTHAKVNLNNFLLGLSEALDKSFHSNQFEVSYNSKRVTYIALRMASYINFEEKYLADIAAFGLLYRFDLEDNDLKKIPFLDLQHLNSTTKEIMELSLLIENNLSIESNVIVNCNEIQELVHQTEVSQEMKENFFDLSEDMIFWLELTNTLRLPEFIYNFLQDFTREIEYKQLIELSEVVDKLVNKSIENKSNNEIGIKAKRMCEFYNMDNKDTSRMVIAAHLHSLGKLFVPKKIYKKSETLDNKEKQAVASIPYFTSSTLSLIYGFNDIAKICSLINEKLDGSGKLYELDGSSLSFNDRLMAILVTYQALLEPRSYRKAYTHNEAIKILKEDADNGKLDSAIIEDFDVVFKG